MTDDNSSPWRHVLGIVGGLGPHAHIELERRLLAAVEPVAHEREYPPWIVSSLPATPDRTRALAGAGPSPAPQLTASLENLAGRADFAVIACITAHAFLGEVRPCPLPVLDVVEATLGEVVERHGENARVGLLATTGTLESRLFPRAAERAAPGLEVLSLLSLTHGERRQQDWVMTAIYGRGNGGLKAGVAVDPDTGTPYVETLRRAAAQLTDAGVDVVVTACTEIGMTLGRDPAFLDPLDVAARQAIAVSRGERPLPR